MRASRVAVLAVVVLGYLLLLVLPAFGQDGESIRGTMRAGPDAVEGAVITVETTDGEPVGETTTDENGNWSVPVPEPGTYVVSIDPETLPEGLTVREDQFSREAEVAAGQSRGVLFPLEGGEGGGGIGTIQRFLNLALNGIKLGSIIAMASIGLSLIFGITGLVNFAHGELVTIGAIAAWLFNVGWLRLPLILATVIALVIGGAAGAALEYGLFRPLRRRKTGLIALLVITIGLSFFLRHVIQMYFGVNPERYREYAIQTTPLTIGPFSLAPRDWAVIVLSLLVLGAVGLLLQGTKLGTAMRAVADNRDLAESSGIDVKKVILATWVAGGALAALGGVFQGLTTAVVSFDMGFALLLLMFAGVIVGGIGTAYGAMVGGLIVGLASEVSTFWFSVELKLVFAFLVLVIVLLVRPQGLLGRKERIG